MTERRLRRVHRRLMEYQGGRRDPSLVAALECGLLNLERDSIIGHPESLHDALLHVQRAITFCEDGAMARALERWQTQQQGGNMTRPASRLGCRFRSRSAPFRSQDGSRRRPKTRSGTLHCDRYCNASASQLPCPLPCKCHDIALPLR